MRLSPALWSTPAAYLNHAAPDLPVLFFSPATLQDTARRFLAGFPGLVTYAVKANDGDAVLDNLMTAGIEAFDVASPFEMEKIRARNPRAVLHYNNPVRSEAEIRIALGYGMASWSVDDPFELDKLLAAGLPDRTEIAVRLRLPVAGAAYHFGAKFGADPDLAVALLKRVAEAGFVPAMTFHPGTQCEAASAWVTYIEASADVARRAGVRLARLNVGGGFPSHRTGDAPALEVIFAAIGEATARAFGADAPALVCEPGRGLVAESFTLAARIKAIRHDGSVFLNDGIYGGLAELPIVGNIDRITVLGEEGWRTGAAVERVVFGPTCDSLDRLKGAVGLPADARPGDYVVFRGLGAYSTATVTRFNGYGAIEIVTTDFPG
ncbi:type III PLP-dependent enzyme [Alphaproteobacteria bacterium GH1-50]|uniref:ornithine decarboxylase n=1 Tax=Kangsaoukella pontilimi TaxID=2691042 RepID=A0A7C9IFY8_9RHOB|nr:type III PLP-dependent enzyme [Kangsaoukella pontilimi]MXQ07908.1 type III PLP-dependent enzyme [Kangsaoukella pontilimi]